MSVISLVQLLSPLLSKLHFAHRCVTAIIYCFIIERHFFEGLVFVTGRGRAHIRVAGAESIPLQALWLVIAVVRIVLPLAIVVGLLDVHVTPFMVHNTTADGSILRVGVLVRAS